MFRKATDVVSTIGTDVEENSFHLAGLEDRFGSHLVVKGLGKSLPLLRVKRKKPRPKPTFEHRALEAGHRSRRRECRAQLSDLDGGPKELMNGANRRDALGLLHRPHKGLRMRSFSMSCPNRS